MGVASDVSVETEAFSGMNPISMLSSHSPAHPDLLSVAEERRERERERESSEIELDHGNRTY